MFWLGGFNGAGCYTHHAEAFSVQRVRKTFVSFFLFLFRWPASRQSHEHQTSGERALVTSLGQEGKKTCMYKHIYSTGPSRAHEAF